MPRPIRRVVTGHDAHGKAVVISDQTASNIVESPKRPGVRFTNLWRTDQMPARIDGPHDALEGAVPLSPPDKGTMFRVIEFQPEDPDVIAKVDGAQAFSAVGGSHHVVAGARHPYMHRTDSVDYAIVLAGEIIMLLDEEDVHLRAGDIVIQRGTNHAWSNRGREPCLMAFILIDGRGDGS